MCALKKIKEIKGPVKLSLPCNVQLSLGPTYKKIKCNHSGLRARGTQYALTKRGRHCTSQDHHAQHNHWRTKDKQHAGMAQSTACSAVILSVHSTFGSSKISTAGLVVFLNIKKYINNYKKIYKKNRKEIASILVYLKNMHTKNKKTKKQYE